jgi:hypothetical protein
MENHLVSSDDRQSAAGGLSLLPVLLCLSAVIALCIGVVVFAISRDVWLSIGISGAAVGVGAALSWWIAPRLLG